MTIELTSVFEKMFKQTIQMTPAYIRNLTPDGHGPWALPGLDPSRCTCTQKTSWVLYVEYTSGSYYTFHEFPLNHLRVFLALIKRGSVTHDKRGGLFKNVQNRSTGSKFVYIASFDQMTNSRLILDNKQAISTRLVRDRSKFTGYLGRVLGKICLKKSFRPLFLSK